MISKEEIEKAKAFMVFYKNYCLNKETANMKDYETVNDEEFVYKNIETILKYIEQLENKVREREDDKQKLIDKLEEKQEKVKDKRSKLGFKTYMKREHMIREDCELLGKQKAYNEILSIVKGENKR